LTGHAPNTFNFVINICVRGLAHPTTIPNSACTTSDSMILFITRIEVFYPNNFALLIWRVSRNWSAITWCAGFVMICSYDFIRMFTNFSGYEGRCITDLYEYLG
jgi:hypothetical protein